MDFNKKGKREFFNDKLLFKIVGVGFIIVIGILVIADFKIYQRKKELINQVQVYKKQIEDIKKSSQTLKEGIANVDNIDYLEKIAYEQLGQQKPGEKQIVFIAPDEKKQEEEKTNNFWSVKVWTDWISGSWQWIKDIF